MIPNFRQTHNCDICYAANFILLSLPCCNFTKVLCVSCILKCFVDLDDFLYKKCPFCTTTDVSVRITSCLNIVSRDIIPVVVFAALYMSILFLDGSNTNCAQ